jgi:hypothetical protein
MLSTSRNAVGDKQAEANTRILEAAPDLLAALKDCIEMLEDWDKAHGPDYDLKNCSTCNAIQAAYRAIAKAESKS